jgi:hypothetical protein
MVKHQPRKQEALYSNLSRVEPKQNKPHEVCAMIIPIV